ncbi:MAG: chemotaxis protein CheW [Cyanobacteria bacterium P01_G01_bin.19]
MSNILPQSNQSKPTVQLLDRTDGKQFLKFYLQQDTKAMLPVRQITEVLTIKFDRIVPIPQMPAWVMGVYNWRGDILWMVDLGHLMGFNPWYQKNANLSKHTAIVLSPDKEQGKSSRESNINLGLVVAQVEDIETLNVAEIQNPTGINIDSHLASFLQGYWLESSKEMIMVLNGQPIIAAMPNNTAA